MRGQKPVTSQQVKAVCAEWGIPIKEGSSGFLVVELSQQQIRIPGATKRVELQQGIVQRLVRALAAELSEQPVVIRETLMGLRSPKAAKYRFKATRESQAIPSKTEMHRHFDQAKESLTSLRDYYDRSFGEVLGEEATKRVLNLRSTLLSFVREVSLDVSTENQRLWEAPDDAGYQPVRHDPLTTGVARATGLTGRLASRRTTATKWQYEGHSAQAEDSV